jgi:putative hemolysin
LALSPLVAVLTWISDLLLRRTGRKRFKGTIFSSRREVRLAIQESAHILSADERAMVDRVLDLQDQSVRSIIVPAARVIGVPNTASIRQVLETFRQHPIHRLPVWSGEGPARRTVGIVSLSALLYAPRLELEQPVSTYAKAPLIFREEVRLEEALRRMQRTRQRTALVLGSDDRELGIVNLREILKSIFGEVTL